MHTQLFRGIDGDAQTVIVENFIQTNASLDTADTDRFLAFGILQSEEIEPCFRCNALVEGFTGVIDLLLQQLASVCQVETGTLSLSSSVSATGVRVQRNWSPSPAAMRQVSLVSSLVP